MNRLKHTFYVTIDVASDMEMLRELYGVIDDETKPFSYPLTGLKITPIDPEVVGRCRVTNKSFHVEVEFNNEENKASKVRQIPSDEAEPLLPF